MTNNDFTPAGYAVPTKQWSFLKLQDGETKIRITSSPIIGWLDWKDSKPVRTTDKRDPLGVDKAGKPVQPRHFWAIAVYDYADGNVKVLEVTQKAIMNSIMEYKNTPEYGSPLNYDIKITKTGKDLETRYTVTPLPPKDLPKDIKAKIDSVKVNLEALWDNGDPFDVADDMGVNDDLPF